MADMKDRIPQGLRDHPAEVKPRNDGAVVDSAITSQILKAPMFGPSMMEEICNRQNMLAALKRVMYNKGKPGVDEVTTEQLPAYLKEHWPRIREQLLTGTYKPSPVRRVEIPKNGSKTDKRLLGIPTCVDRLIQQATLQVMQPVWDPFFSDSSYGFRPGRSCHQAVMKAQEYLKEGHSYVVDIDLEKFFDNVNHDRLMSRLAQSICDVRVIKLIRSYLNAGIMINGLVTIPTEGTPQGGPLSPFLSNVVLDELDRELASRGLKFVRYADDCNIYVRSLRSGQRVMDSISRFIHNRLRLKVNQAKSAVARPSERKFLGFSFTKGRNPNKRKISPQSMVRFRAAVREKTRRQKSQKVELIVASLNSYLKHWYGYYRLTETDYDLMKADQWIRHRLRSLIWKQWKTFHKRRKELVALGVDPLEAAEVAGSSKGPWRISSCPAVHKALNNNFFCQQLGLFRLVPS
jgi:RNA-directed DNA polymerase